LQALPEELLREVLQRASRTARLTCKQLLHGYASLRFGMWLEAYSTTELLHILRRLCERLKAASSLRLGGMPDDPVYARFWQLQGAAHRCHLRLYGGVAEQVAKAFPRLQSLALPDDMLAGAAEVRALAPLSSCVTALRANLWCNGHHAAAVRGLETFTALRSLTVARWAAHDVEEPRQVERWLQSLECLPSLQHLDLRARALNEQCGCHLSAQQWVPGLASAAPQLTWLALGPAVDWDDGAVGALRSQFPALRRLSMQLQDWRNPTDFDYGIEPGDDDERFAAVAAALRQRTALTFLRMSTEHLLPGSVIALPPQVQDVSISCQSEDKEHVQAQLQAVAGASSLTRLQILSLDSAVASAGVVSALLAHASMLQALHCASCEHRIDERALATLVECAAQLPHLRALNLHLRSSSDWPARARGLLAGMTQLEELRMPAACMPAEVVCSITSLTRLSRLELSKAPNGARAGVGQAVDALLQRMQPLQQLKHLLLPCGGTSVSSLGQLALLRSLEELQLDLKVESARALRRLHTTLLPLPPTLRRLRVRQAAVPAAAYDAIAAAAGLIGCVVYMQRSPPL
jgi:hypothetical protein